MQPLYVNSGVMAPVLTTHGNTYKEPKDYQAIKKYGKWNHEFVWNSTLCLSPLYQNMPGKYFEFALEQVSVEPVIPLASPGASFASKIK